LSSPLSSFRQFIFVISPSSRKASKIIGASSFCPLSILYAEAARPDHADERDRAGDAATENLPYIKSFVAQCCQRIDLNRASRGQVACQRRYSG
jgi:hypothetical protein